MAKLEWHVAKDENGKFLRRKLDGEDNLGLDHVDVEWTCDTGFPEDTVEVPVTHPPEIKYETRKVGARKAVKDQVSVSPNVSDGTIAIMLDDKRPALAKALGISLS